MKRKRAAIVAAGIMLSTFLAGCGATDEPAVTTAATGGPATSATAGSGTVAAYVEAQRKPLPRRAGGPPVPDGGTGDNLTVGDRARPGSWVMRSVVVRAVAAWVYRPVVSDAARRTVDRVRRGPRLQPGQGLLGVRACRRGHALRVAGLAPLVVSWAAISDPLGFVRGSSSSARNIPQLQTLNGQVMSGS
jgi:hypothetical protein